MTDRNPNDYELYPELTSTIVAVGRGSLAPDDVPIIVLSVGGESVPLYGGEAILLAQRLLGEGAELLVLMAAPAGGTP